MFAEKRVIRSSCRGCHGVCQVLIHLEGGKVMGVTGDPDSPTSRGFICPKGAASPQFLYHPDRLSHPLKRIGNRGKNRWQAIPWDQALDEMVQRLDAIRKESGTEYFAMEQGTGRPYTAFNIRFANAFGTPNFSFPSHVCYLPRVAASAFSLGQLPVCDLYGFGGIMPECIVIWGCNVTYTGASDGMCGATVQRAIKRAEKVIVIDPRRIGPAKNADHWLQIRPGTDGALALAMLNVVISEGLIDHEFVDNHTKGFDALVEHVRSYTPEWASPITTLSADQIRTVTHIYATTKPACIQWGNGIDMSRSCFHTARAILTLSALTGDIDAPGGDVLWVPPEKIKQRSPFMNREVLGERFLSPEKRKRAVDEGRFPLNLGVQTPALWHSIIEGQPYRVRGMWIVGANPLLTASNSLKVEEALRKLEYLVVSDFFLTPTAQLADLVLPAATWLEQDDIVNLHKIWCVLARKKVAQIGEVRDDREVIIQVARRLGLFDAFPWADYRTYLEWVLEDTGMNFDEFCEKGILTSQMRYRKFQTDGFATPSKKFEIYSADLENMGISPLPVYREPPMTPLSAPETAQDYPLILTSSGKIREFFHSEGRQIESLRRANPDPTVEINPETARSLGIQQGEWVVIETSDGSASMRAKLVDGIAPGVVAAQYGWWYPEESPPGYGWKKSSYNLLFGKMDYDPEVGAESLRSGLCRVYPCLSTDNSAC